MTDLPPPLLPPPAPDLTQRPARVSRVTPPSGEPETPRIGRPPKYPWDDWLGSPHAYTLRKGRDYDCSTKSILQQARRAARDRGVQLDWFCHGSVNDADEIVIWTVHDDDEEH